MNLFAKYRIQILAFIKFLMPRSHGKAESWDECVGETWQMAQVWFTSFVYWVENTWPSSHLLHMKSMKFAATGETLNCFFFNVIVIWSWSWSSFSHINHFWTVTSAYEAKHLGLLSVMDKYWLKHLCGERQQVCLLPFNVKCSLPLRRQKKKKTQPFSWVVLRGSRDNSDRRGAKREREGMCELVRGAKSVSRGSIMSHS